MSAADQRSAATSDHERETSPTSSVIDRQVAQQLHDTTSSVVVGDDLALARRVLDQLGNAVPSDWKGNCITINHTRLPDDPLLCLEWAEQHCSENLQFLTLFCAEVNRIYGNRHTAQEHQIFLAVEKMRKMLVDTRLITDAQFEDDHRGMVEVHARVLQEKNDRDKAKQKIADVWGEAIFTTAPWLDELSSNRLKVVAPLCKSMTVEDLRCAAQRSVRDRLATQSETSTVLGTDFNPTPNDLKRIRTQLQKGTLDFTPLDVHDRSLSICTKAYRYNFRPSATTAALEVVGPATFIGDTEHRVVTVPNTPADRARPTHRDSAATPETPTHSSRLSVVPAQGAIVDNGLRQSGRLKRKNTHSHYPSADSISKVRSTKRRTKVDHSGADIGIASREEGDEDQCPPNDSCACGGLDAHTHELLNGQADKTVAPDDARALIGSLELALERQNEICKTHLHTALALVGLFPGATPKDDKIRLSTSAKAYDDGRLEAFACDPVTQFWLYCSEQDGATDHTSNIDIFAYKHTPIEIVVTDGMAMALVNSLGGNIWQQWQRDGTITHSIFGWWDKQNLLTLARTEANMYRHHECREATGADRGWARTMWYSLAQQAMRMDPGFYVLFVCLRRDHNYRLISYPSHAKYADVGDETRFLQLDVNPAKLAGHAGASLIRGSLSLDKETVDNCQQTVNGMHRVFPEWQQALVNRGVRIPTTEVVEIDLNMWSPADEKSFDIRIQRTPCAAGDVRIWRADLINGDQGPATSIRRVLLPCFVGIGDDQETLDEPELGTWSELSLAHARMIPSPHGPSGHSFDYPKPKSAFQASVQLDVDVPICKALVGRLPWDNRQVLEQVEILLCKGTDSSEALVAEIRAKIGAAWRKAWVEVQEREKQAFEGDRSYFRFHARPGGSRPQSDFYQAGGDKENSHTEPIEICPPLGSGVDRTDEWRDLDSDLGAGAEDQYR